MTCEVISTKNYPVRINMYNSVLRCEILDNDNSSLFWISYYPEKEELIILYDLVHSLILHVKKSSLIKLFQKSEKWKVLENEENSIYRAKIDDSSIEFVHFPDYPENLFEINVMIKKYANVISLMFKY